MICGKARSGKDTVANYLVKKHSLKKDAFAKPIKDMVKIQYGWTEDHVNGELKDVVDPFWGISPRQALQSLGTDYAQDYLCMNYPDFKKTTGANVWVKSFAKRMDLVEDYVLSDYRFSHEFHYLANILQEENKQVVTLKITRNKLDTKVEDHKSELSLKDLYVDYEIDNNSTLEDLYKKLDNWWEEIERT